MVSSVSEMPRRLQLSYVCFSLALCIALGSCQFILPVRTALFYDLVGTGQEPLAKSLVLAVVVPVLLVYSLLFSATQDPKLLVLLVGGFFAAAYLLLALVLLRTKGHPGGWYAWILYYVTECRAVILMPMLWSIVSDLTTSELARVTYPLIFFVVQLGGITGALAAVNVSSLGDMVGLILLQAGLLLGIVGLTWFGCLFNDGTEDAGDPERAPLASALLQSGCARASAPAREPPPEKRRASASMLWEASEGLWLLLSRPYALMVFWVSYAVMMPKAVLDYTSGVLVNQAYPARTQQVAFWGHMSLCQNCMTAVLTLVGTKPIMRALGVGHVLLVLPVTVLGCVIAVCVHGGLWVSGFAVVTANVMAHGLNSPCKEILYTQTSRDIKYKARAWSAMFGSEVMKLLGTQMSLWVNRASVRCRPDCFREGPTQGVVAVWVVVWLGVAYAVGRQYEDLEERGAIVE